MRNKETKIIPGTEIAERIITKLKEKQGNLSLYKICKFINMDRSGLRKMLENPNSFKVIQKLKLICEYLGVEMNEIVGIKESPPDIIELKRKIDLLKKENSRKQEIINEIEKLVKPLNSESINKLIRTLSDDKFNLYKADKIKILIEEKKNEKI